MLSRVYKIQRIREKHTNEIHEREIRRQGYKLKIVGLEKGKPLVFEYLEGGYLYTSPVVSFRVNWDDSLIVVTQNTIYFFEAE